MKLKIAVPSKGRISNPSIDILEKAGLGLKDNNNRQLISKTHNKNIGGSTNSKHLQGKAVDYRNKHTLTLKQRKEVINYCFNTVHLDYLVCCHFIENTRSKRVIEKNNC